MPSRTSELASVPWIGVVMKRTKEELLSALKDKDREATILQYALCALMDKKEPDAAYCFFHEDEKVRLCVFNYDAPYGGIIIRTQVVGFQKPFHAAYYYDDWARKIRALSSTSHNLDEKRAAEHFSAELERKSRESV